MSQIESEPELSRWRGVFAAAGIAALLSAAFIPLQFVVFIGWPPPTSHSLTEWFALFQSNPILGLLSLDLLMMVEQLLIVPIVIASWVLLHRTSESLMALASTLWLVAAALLVSSNTGFEMLSLSHGYAAATTDAARAAYAGAAQGMLASYWDMGSAFVFGYVLTALAGILVGVAMLRNRVFTRAAGWAVLSGNVVGLGIFLPGIGIPLALLSVVVLWAWYVLVGIRFVRLAVGGSRTTAAAFRLESLPHAG